MWINTVTIETYELDGTATDLETTFTILAGLPGVMEEADPDTAERLRKCLRSLRDHLNGNPDHLA